MRFERTQTVVTYLLVSTGFLVLFLSGELPPPYWLIFVPAVLATMVWRGDSRVASATLWNALLVVALVSLVLLGVTTGDWLLNAVYFASLMVVAKLFQGGTARDTFQLYALSFLQLVAGAVINPTLSFAVCFLVYVVLLTWGLVMLHLQRDIERLAGLDENDPAAADFRPAGGWRMERLIGPGFLFGTSILALVIFACSILVFLLFPRLGLGFFGQHRRSGTDVSGFSDAVQLGHFGRLKMDQTVVMRVEIDGASVSEVLPLRLKGITFDTYDGKGGWSKSRAPVWELARTEAGGFLGIYNFGEVPEDALHFTQKVYLEQLRMDRKAVFAEARALAVRDMVSDKYVFDYRRRTKFFQDMDMDLTFASSRSSPLRYEVRSVRVGRPVEALRQAKGDPPGARMRPYLQLPDPPDPRIARLAAEVVAGKTNAYDQVAAIERYLVTNYAYSLEGGHDADDPLGDFLFDKRPGHCEYFASAMALMVRTLGIPARVVGGFYGGAPNDVGDYIAIRQADAHSWVEVYFPTWGWIVFDATPPSGALVGPDDSWWARLGRYVDSMQLLWYKWVIRWDLERQLAFLRSIGKKIAGLRDLVGGKDGKSSWNLAWLRSNTTLTVLLVLFGFVLFALGVVYRDRLRGYFRRGPPDAPRRAYTGRDVRIVRRLYGRLLSAVERQGVDVGPATTPGRILEVLEESSPRAAEHAAPVLRVYEEVLFGGLPLSAGAEGRCREHLRNLKRA